MNTFANMSANCSREGCTICLPVIAWSTVVYGTNDELRQAIAISCGNSKHELQTDACDKCEGSLSYVSVGHWHRGAELANLSS